MPRKKPPQAKKKVAAPKKKPASKSAKKTGAAAKRPSPRKKAAARKSAAVKEPLTQPIIPARLIKPGCPVVGLGASAGGLEALDSFFRAVPESSGCAYVVVVHLDPTHISILPELLQKCTKMTVSQIADGMAVKPNHVYIIPPNKNVNIIGGALSLSDLGEPRSAIRPIDSFLRSLAQDQERNAVCIILSGTGTDGTIGARAVKGGSGMVIVQNEESAKYDGMPRSAIGTGLVDFILPPHKMPAQIVKYTRHAKLLSISDKDQAEDAAPIQLQKILVILRSRTNHDFSLYKRNTIYRRIERRMNVHQIDDISDYVHYLHDSEREADILFKELLIGVTSFFRDPDLFEHLQQNVFPKMLQGKPEDYTIRAWSAGCSSGEEAYTLAIALHEYMERSGTHYHVQIFGTDIDETAIDVARAGIYPESIESDLGPDRTRRYFIKEDSGRYIVKKQIREMLVFAPQNVIKDPPFTKLDLLCCRNLLIYLGTELQRRLMPVFNYSLKPNGILVLGSSETIGQATDLFAPQNKKLKVFTRKNTGAQPYRILAIPPPADAPTAQEIALPVTVQKAEEISALQLVETILKQTVTPPCAIINDASDVVYIHGSTGRFLETPEGKISVNILEMARSGLKNELSSAIKEAATYNHEVTRKGLRIGHGDSRLFLDLTVKPILEQSAMRGLMMVIFEETTEPSKRGATKVEPKRPRKSAEELEEELRYNKENLQTTIEELETSNEELKSTNEELQSTNEEMQSTNEELETSKEELQSLNEEASTVNTELQARIDELSITTDDMKNLLDSTHIATLFLDTDMNIRRFTPALKKIVPLAATDFERPIGELASRLIDVDIAEQSQKVLSELAMLELEVESRDNTMYLMRIRPYRTTANVIDGVVITFEDITESRHDRQTVMTSELMFRSLFELASDSVVLIDPDTDRIDEFNDRAHRHLGYTKEEFSHLALSDIESGDATQKYMEIVAKRGTGEFDTTQTTKSGKDHEVHVRGKAIEVAGKIYLLSTWSDRKANTET